MTHEPRTPADDRDFERTLETVQAAWDAMEAVEPPELLDLAVRNAARRDLEASARKRPLRWLGGFATATVVVLAVSLVLWQDTQSPAPPADGSRLDAPPPPAATDALRLEKSALPAAEPTVPAQEMNRDAAEPRLQTRQAARTFEIRERAVEEEAPSDLEESIHLDDLAESVDAETTREPPLPPEAWIEDMLSLLEKGDEEALARSLERFTETYPEYPLPAELADRLP